MALAQPKILWFVLTYKVIVCACAGGVGCRFHTVYVLKVWGELTGVSSLSTGVLRFEHRLLGVGTDSFYSLSHLGTLLFKMCCVYAGLCICQVQMHECVYVQQRVCGIQKTALALCYPQILWGWHSSLCAQVVPLYQPSRPQHYVSFCHSGFQRSHLLFILLWGKYVANRSSWIFIWG